MENSIIRDPRVEICSDPWHSYKEYLQETFLLTIPEYMKKEARKKRMMLLHQQVKKNNRDENAPTKRNQCKRNPTIPNYEVLTVAFN